MDRAPHREELEGRLPDDWLPVLVNTVGHLPANHNGTQFTMPPHTAREPAPRSPAHCQRDRSLPSSHSNPLFRWQGDIISEASAEASAPGVPAWTQHNGFFPDFYVTDHKRALIILVLISFGGWFFSAWLYRQCNLNVRESVSWVFILIRNPPVWHSPFDTLTPVSPPCKQEPCGVCWVNSVRPELVKHFMRAPQIFMVRQTEDLARSRAQGSCSAALRFFADWRAVALRRPGQSKRALDHSYSRHPARHRAPSRSDSQLPTRCPLPA